MKENVKKKAKFAKNYLNIVNIVIMIKREYLYLMTLLEDRIFQYINKITSVF